MTLTYNLTQDDYLYHQLFMASQSDIVKNQRRKGWIIWSIALLCLAWMFYQKKDSFLAYYFLVFGILNIIFYPSFSGWYYKRYYKKHVTEVFRNRFDKKSTLSINDDQIHEIDEAGETKVSTSEVEKIFETDKYFLIKLKSGVAFMIPKFTLDNLNLVTKQLKQIAQNKNIDFVEMQNWRWT